MAAAKLTFQSWMESQPNKNKPDDTTKMGVKLIWTTMYEDMKLCSASLIRFIPNGTLQICISSFFFFSLKVWLKSTFQLD